jgi:energy-coupling factor transport system substrate-specific component
MASAAVRRVPANVSMTQAVMLVALAAAVDVLGGWVAGLLKVPVFLDTVGTFVAAAVLGPWWGAAAGVGNNVVSALFNGPSSIPFAIVSVAVALVWGYGLRTFGMGRNGWTLLSLNLVVALVAALVSAPIVYLVFGGATGHPSDALTLAFEALGKGLASAVLVSNLILNVADKLITGYVGLAIVEALPDQYTAGLRLPAMSRLGILGMAAVGVGVGVVLGLVYLALPAGS